MSGCGDCGRSEAGEIAKSLLFSCIVSRVAWIKLENRGIRLREVVDAVQLHVTLKSLDVRIRAVGLRPVHRIDVFHSVLLAGVSPKMRRMTLFGIQLP